MGTLWSELWGEHWRFAHSRVYSIYVFNKDRWTQNLYFRGYILSITSKTDPTAILTLNIYFLWFHNIHNSHKSMGTLWGQLWGEHWRFAKNLPFKRNMIRLSLTKRNNNLDEWVFKCLETLQIFPGTARLPQCRHISNFRRTINRQKM